jgi:dGTPase
MPGRWGRAFNAAPDARAAARIVCDFVSGMTDPYAEQEHARMFQSGSSPVRSTGEGDR